MTVSDNTIVAEGSSDFFMNPCKKGFNASKRMAGNVLKKPGRALHIGANVSTAFASSSPKAALPSLLELVDFLFKGKVLYLGKFVRCYAI